MLQPEKRRRRRRARGLPPFLEQDFKAGRYVKEQQTRGVEGQVITVIIDRRRYRRIEFRGDVWWEVDS